MLDSLYIYNNNIVCQFICYPTLTNTIQLSSLLHRSTKDILCILVKAQPSTRSTGPRSPTRLGIWSQDLGLPDEYSLGHCGLSAACRHKLAFTRRLHALLTATDTTVQHDLLANFPGLPHFLLWEWHYDQLAGYVTPSIFPAYIPVTLLLTTVNPAVIIIVSWATKFVISSQQQAKAQAMCWFLKERFQAVTISQNLS